MRPPYSWRSGLLSLTELAAFQLDRLNDSASRSAQPHASKPGVTAGRFQEIKEVDQPAPLRPGSGLPSRLRRQAARIPFPPQGQRPDEGICRRTTIVARSATQTAAPL